MSYTVRKIARELGISRQRVHQFIKMGRLKSKKEDWIHVIEDEEAKRFIASERKRTGRPKKKQEEIN